MTFELWTGEISIIEIRIVFFTWIQTTYQTTTIEAPTSLHEGKTRTCCKRCERKRWLGLHDTQQTSSLSDIQGIDRDYTQQADIGIDISTTVLRMQRTGGAINI